LNALQDYTDCRIVSYEDLCDDPRGQFRAMFDFAGLRWDENTEERIRTQTTQGDRNEVWGTARDTRSQRDDWRGRATAAQLADMRAAYTAHGLPWYGAADDW